MDKQIKSYIAQLDEQEKLVLEIAKDHLGSSFDIERSIGFTSWLKTQPESKNDKVKSGK
tara:strand:+ start:1388 stop:1564 length:177 start_codon:yes stop_codon:yes gene_type:complete